MTATMATGERVSIRKVLVIYNPRAGTLLHGNESDPEAMLRGLFERRGIDANLHAFDADALDGWIEAADADDTDAVVVCGGDGSILAVVTAIGERGITLGLLPGGTMNILARDLGLPDDLDAAADVIAAGRTQHIDVGLVNDQPFLCHSSLGLMPHLARKRERWRDWPAIFKWPRTFFGLLGMLRKFPRLHIVIDDGRQTRNVVTRALAISNNRLDDTRGPIPTRASLDDGELGIYVAEDASRWTLLRVMARVLIGNWADDVAMERSTATSVVLTLDRARPLSVMNDGEPMQLQTPLRYTLRPQALRVLIPAPALTPIPARGESTEESQDIDPGFVALPG